MSSNIYENLQQLGGQTALPETPEAAVLERVQNPQAGTAFAVRFTAPEFTSLCPMTGQPDFAHLVIDYVPGEFLVESKSLKLYLGAFRNHGAFHEDCTVSIAKRLTEFLTPQWLRIGGYWYPRGGIPIDVFYQTDPSPTPAGFRTKACPPIVGADKLAVSWAKETGPLASFSHQSGTTGVALPPTGQTTRIHRLPKGRIL